MKPICMETCTCLDLCEPGEVVAELRKHDGFDGFTPRDLDALADAMAASDWAARGGVG